MSTHNIGFDGEIKKILSGYFFYLIVMVYTTMSFETTEFWGSIKFCYTQSDQLQFDGQPKMT